MEILNGVDCHGKLYRILSKFLGAFRKLINL